jgi:hypothetical protein
MARKIQVAKVCRRTTQNGQKAQLHRKKSPAPQDREPNPWPTKRKQTMYGIATNDHSVELHGSLDLCCKLVQMLRMFPEDREVYLPILERVIEDTCDSYPKHAILETLYDVKSKSATQDYHWAMKDLRNLMLVMFDRVGHA